MNELDYIIEGLRDIRVEMCNAANGGSKSFLENLEECQALALELSRRCKRLAPRCHTDRGALNLEEAAEFFADAALDIGGAIKEQKL